MKKKKLITIICSALAGVILLSVILVVALAGKSGKKDSILIMTDELSGLFNPFYATAAADHDVVGMTQIGMLSTDTDKDDNPVTAAGDDYSTVVKAYTYEKVGENTVYKFVIKNGLKFSDGKPLTMNDVMFNIYEYLDPVYTGSSTMYSTKIEGLAAYRRQIPGATNDEANTQFERATQMAEARLEELETIYRTTFDKETDANGNATPAKMKDLIANWPVSAQYQAAFANDGRDYNKQLAEDYDYIYRTLKTELENDYKAAKSAFDLENKNSPYFKHKDLLKSDVIKFLIYVGDVVPEYGKDADNKEDLSNITGFKFTERADGLKGMDDTGAYFLGKTIQYSFHNVVTGYFATYNTVLTKFEADAKSIILKSKGTGTDGNLEVPNISGIRSLGHTGTDTEVVVAAGEGKTVGGDIGSYTIAKEHNADGTPKNKDEYDVLQITVEGTDPKAIYNFGFTVAPQHYYAHNESTGVTETVDIANNKFGLKFGDSDFQTNVIQSQRHVSVPLGAGPYVATDKYTTKNFDSVKAENFNRDNYVYYRANENFMFPVKCEKVRLVVVSSSNAIDKLAKGEVDYITPQLTNDNYDRVQKLSGQGIEMLSAWQLGYGYIGINAGKVKNVWVRRAIMAAMNTKDSIDYYRAGTAKQIYWPMSLVSWAHPKDNAGDSLRDNGAEYTVYVDDASAKDLIRQYMANAESAGVTTQDYKITFTIAGSSITDHPTYNVFNHAMELLNDLGWQVTVRADSSALTKLATGSLEVWAAAWGSTIDPDMYQVYHKDSSATSTKAWGYREIANDAELTYEKGIVDDLSKLIDQGRTTDDQASRKETYKEAMKLVLELAVEMPVYQRQNLYAYNSKNVKGFSTKVNPYSSPLEKIWELELK